jgi:predicted solute-binding protein
MILPKCQHFLCKEFFQETTNVRITIRDKIHCFLSVPIIYLTNGKNRKGLEESKSNKKSYTSDLPNLFYKYLELPNVFATLKHCLENSKVAQVAN